jgi:hypothetical protein
MPDVTRPAACPAEITRALFAAVLICMKIPPLRFAIRLFYFAR